MQDKQDSKTGIRVIPPVIFLMAVAAAFLANWFWPVALLPDVVRYTLGPVLILGSFAVMPSVFGAFKRADTPFDARRMPNALVTEGPFRFSRNPGYVALIVLCIGIAVVADNPWGDWGQVLSLMFFELRTPACGNRTPKTLKTRPDPSARPIGREGEPHWKDIIRSLSPQITVNPDWCLMFDSEH